MKKLLVSWIGYQFDFTPDGRELSPTSPNWGLHKTIFKNHTAHYILAPKNTQEPENQEKMDLKTGLLFTALREKYPKRRIEIIEVDILSPYDFEEVYQKTKNLLKIWETQYDQIDILVSTGTSLMRAVWFLLHSQSIAPTKLIQGRENDVFVAVGLENRYKAIFSPNTDIPLTPTHEKVYRDAQKYANLLDKDLKTNILIIGESGTGKEHLAKSIHKNSPLKSQTFKPINCAAFQESTLLSELYGHAKGAFTDAKNEKKGLIAASEGGILFMDEIGDTSKFMQASLLRFLENKTYRALGSEAEKTANVKIIAATNQPLAELCEKGQFRYDLYVRLSTWELHLPAYHEHPVAERKAWIEQKLQTIREKMRAQNIDFQDYSFTPEAEQRLIGSRFRGNFREIENCLQKWFFLEKTKITIDDFPKNQMIEETPTNLEAMTIQHIKKIRSQCQTDQEAIKLLGISRGTYYRYMKKSE